MSAKAFTPSAEALLIDKAQPLARTAPEMTVLCGLRLLRANTVHSKHGEFTQEPALTSDFSCTFTHSAAALHYR